jgi:hypothetical protein
MIINYDRNCRLIVLSTIKTIVNYVRKTFIVQATGVTLMRNLSDEIFEILFINKTKQWNKWFLLGWFSFKLIIE